MIFYPIIKNWLRENGMSKIGNKIKNIIKYIKKKEVIPIPYTVNSNHLLDGKVALITGGS